MDIKRTERAGSQPSPECSKSREEKPSSSKQWTWKNRRFSVLPLKWRLRHSSRWTGHLLASELSLLAFILLMVMVFSKKWLYPSMIRCHQPWHSHVTKIINNSAQILSMGILQIGKAKSSDNSNGRVSFHLWKNHPFFGLAMFSFCLALGMGFILTIWLHLPYLPGCQRLHLFVWIGTIMSVCEGAPSSGKVVFIFFTLMFFPIDLWIFEVKMNVTIPIGWGYFIGWLVFILYVTCGVFCYFSNRHFRGVIQRHPSGISFSNSCSSSVKDYVSKLFQISVKKKQAQHPKKKASLDHGSSTN